MSEAEAAPGRIEDEEEDAMKRMEPAPAKKIKEERRSSSTDISDELMLETICYKGTKLKLPSDQDQMYQVVFRIMKNVYQPLVESLLVGLPHGWNNLAATPGNAEIASYCKKFNLAARPYAKNWSGSFNTETLKDWGQPNCTFAVAAEITSFAYECAVPRPSDLNNHYKSFSSETYGETNLEQMTSIIEEIKLGPNDVFVDLGSGIGQLVCFVAAAARCHKSVGIELSSTPAECAADMAIYFKRMMGHFGKHYGNFELLRGNFLDPKFKKLITEEATVIYINNYAFGPDLMFNITNMLLQELKHGIRIITTRAFGSNKREITYRSTSDINSMSRTQQLKTVDGAVSWTANKVDFFLTTMDHTKLIEYYAEEQRKKLEPKNISREGSEITERESSSKKRKNDHVNGREKIKTEQAAASHPHQTPKWDEPDTDYTPPAKKPKKHRERENHEPKPTTDASTSSKKKKSVSVPKTPKEKPSKSSHSSRHSHSVERSSVQMAASSHHTPSLAKATAPPPNHQERKPKIEEFSETEKVYGQFDAKTMRALDTIREAASTSTQAAAIQDAIATVLAQPELSPSQTAAGGPPVFSINPNVPAPATVYTPSQIIAPPPPLPNAIPPTLEVVAEQRHTFMIPPTDPYYNMVVSAYFEFKNHVNQARNGDPMFMSQLRNDIENEKTRHNDLQESINLTKSQIDSYLQSGVSFLKNRLDELGMTSVNDVSELLSGSKHIVTQHKSLTTEHAQLETMVAMEEQKLRLTGGPDAVRIYDEAVSKGIQLDLARFADGIYNNRSAFAVNAVHIDDASGSDTKVSPTRRSRATKPRQTASNGKRGPSGTRKADASNEEIETEIQNFVQRALQVDHAVKEKERKARGNFSAATERVPRKGATATAGSTHLLQCSPSPNQLI